MALPDVFHTPGGTTRRAGLLADVRAAGARVREVSPEVMAHLTSATTAPDVLAVGPLLETRLDGVLPSSAVVLDAVRDPATAGGIMASAAAVGIGCVVFGHGSVDAFSPKTVRSAAGSHYVLKVVRDVAADESAARFRDGGARVVALAVDGPAPWATDLSGPVVFLVGASGIVPQEATPVGIPAASVGPSLTARAAVVLYEWLRQGAGVP